MRPAPKGDTSRAPPVAARDNSRARARAKAGRRASERARAARTLAHGHEKAIRRNELWASLSAREEPLRRRAHLRIAIRRPRAHEALCFGPPRTESRLPASRWTLSRRERNALLSRQELANAASRPRLEAKPITRGSHSLKAHDGVLAGAKGRLHAISLAARTGVSLGRRFPSATPSPCKASRGRFASDNTERYALLR